MNLLILEDEPLAAERLIGLIQKNNPGVNILGVCQSIKQAEDWLKNNSHPELAFFDIQLGDGLSFELFDKIEFNFPVIFTTAFDSYAIKAFKVNSVDYLLKPIDEKELLAAINKFNERTSYNNSSLLNLIHQMQVSSQSYKERFLVKVGEHLKMISTVELSFIYSQDKATFIRTKDGKNLCLDQSVDALETQLDPTRFFRISRKYLVALDAIEDMVYYGISRLKVKMKGVNKEDEIIVSRDRVKAFKQWCSGD